MAQPARLKKLFHFGLGWANSWDHHGLRTDST